VGRHWDGDGLHLIVSENGRRKWVLRFQMNGARRDMGSAREPRLLHFLTDHPVSAALTGNAMREAALAINFSGLISDQALRDVRRHGL
jgi:hypothetical protein